NLGELKMASCEPLSTESLLVKHHWGQPISLKKTQKKDKIGSKPDKNGKRGEAEKSQKQLQWIEEEKLNKMQKEGPEMQSLPKL
nr:hypothetical protein [Tanacetum cinerariifolium]